jgi:ATP-binding cassette subfamily B protein
MNFDGTKLVEWAVGIPGGKALSDLDGAIRMARSLIDSDAISSGSEAAALVSELVRSAATNSDAIPENYRVAIPHPDSPSMIQYTGAVMVKVSGARKVDPSELASPELRAAVGSKKFNPLEELLTMLRQDGQMRLGLLALGLALVASGLVIEALLFRSLFDIAGELSLGEQRLGALIALMAFAGILLLMEFPVERGIRALGRGFETRLRLRFFEKLAVLPDQYLRSRPSSDMASRAHVSHRMKLLAELAGQLLRAVFQIAITVVALLILDPATGLVAGIGAIAIFTLHWFVQRILSERDMRFETHTGGLTRFYLDALVGLQAIRSHGAERAVRREHEGQLVEWGHAGLDLQRAAALAKGGVAILGFITAALCVWVYAGGPTESGALLLVAYWALTLPAIGEEIAQVAQRYPMLRTTTLRLLEPLSSPEEDASERANPINQAATLEWKGVEVIAAGNSVLRNIDLRIDAGEHVAIVGRSGAGKSTLLATLLGWHRPHAGIIELDGLPLTTADQRGLLRRTAWVDPEVMLWNRSLLDNVCYGNNISAPRAARLMDAAELGKVVENMPDGLQSFLGEEGKLVSGGEGQRVRLARALAARAPRLALFDEPFRGLDRTQRRRLLAAAREHLRGVTLLCVTHDIADVEDFDRVIVIEDGHIVEEGHPAQLMQRNGRYAQLATLDRESQQHVWKPEIWRPVRVENGSVRGGR